MAPKQRKSLKREGDPYRRDPTGRRPYSGFGEAAPAAVMDEWPVQEAKARFSELLENAESRGPQIVTKRGEKKAVLVSIREWERLTSPRKRNIIEILTAPEARIDDLHVPDRKSYRWRNIPKF